MKSQTIRGTPPDHLDEGDADPLDDRHGGLPPQRQQDAQRQRQDDAGGADDDGEHEAAERLGADGRAGRWAGRCRRRP